MTKSLVNKVVKSNPVEVEKVWVQIIVHTTGGEVLSRVNEVTEEEAVELRNGIKNNMNEKLTYLDIDTEDGWVIVPGNQLLYIEAKVS